MDENASIILPFSNREQYLGRTIIAFVDLQQEYTANGRAYALNDISKCLDNCRDLLCEARRSGMTIAHFRLLRSSSFFNPAAQFSQWIDEFRPRANEMVFERKALSLFSKETFGAFVKEIHAPELILVGLAGQQGCLATVLEVVHQDISMTFVKDASASHSLGNYSQAQCHGVVTEIIGQHAMVCSTKEILLHIKKLQHLNEREV